MKKAILILFLCICTQFTHAQSGAVYSFGDSTRSCVGDAGFVDMDGNYVMMGRRSGAGNLYSKFDSNNAELWSFITPNSFAVQGWRMFQTSNKDYIGVLSTGVGAVIIRISESGNIVWNRTLGQITSLRDGFEDTNGDLYFSGFWSNRAFVIRLDANGNETWCKKITTGESTHSGISINPTADGSIMLAGMTYSSGTNPAQITLSKVSKAGQLIWGYSYTMPSLQLFVNDMEISTLDQSIVLAGFSIDYSVPYNANTSEAIVIKIDSTGNFVSFKSLGISGKEDKFTAITQVPYANNPLFVMSGTSQAASGATKLLLSSVDNGAGFANIKTYGDNHGNGFFFDQINYDPTHGINVMGTGSGFYATNASEYQFALCDTSLTLPCKAFTHSLVQANLNLNRSGNFAIANHTLTYDSTLFTQIADSLTAFNSCTGDSIYAWPTAVNNFGKVDVKLFPNPVQGMLNIDFGDTEFEELFVRDMSGKIIYTVDNKTSLIQIETNEWVSGLYFIDAKLQNGQRFIRKVMVR